MVKNKVKSMDIPCSGIFTVKLKHRNYDTVQADLMVLFNPLQPGVALLCPLKTSENL